MKTFHRRLAPTSLDYVHESEDSIEVTGYACVFNQPYSMGWYQEEVSPGAFSRTLGREPDVRFLVNHEGLPLARTTSGTLTLKQDDTGLLVSAQLDPTDPDVAALVPKLRRGDLNQMSFAFRYSSDSQKWNDDLSAVTLSNLELDGGDVSAVTYPANPYTSISLARSVGMFSMQTLAHLLTDLDARYADPAEYEQVLSRALNYIQQDGSPEQPFSASHERAEALADCEGATSSAFRALSRDAQIVLSTIRRAATDHH